jgi:DNA modification methylase
VIAKSLYEYFLPKNKKSVVFDCCSGFGGRFLGSVMSDRDIHYIGNDVNSKIFNDDSYNKLAQFLKEHLGITSTYHIEKRGSEEMNESKELKNYENSVDLFLTSPPYFSKEKYSNDETQSYLKFPNYKDWVQYYLKKTFEIVHHSLKPNAYCLLNVSDINLNETYFPLELDSIKTLESIGFEYQYQIGMVMNKYIGLSYEGVLNKWWDKESNCFRKVEPILVFQKV